MAPCLPRPVRHALGLVVAGLLAVAGCTDDGPGRPDELGQQRNGPNPGAPPTMPGGVELPAADPAVALVGTDLAYGTPLPSEQLAADALTQDPEVVSVLTRRVFVRPEARHLADVIALTLDGAEVFDEAALAAYEQALVASLGGGQPTTAEIAGRPVITSTGEGRTAMGHREGDLLVVVLAPAGADALLVVTRQAEARARGEVGVLDPATPMASLPPEAAFVEVPSVLFALFPPPEEDPFAPEVPGLAGATGVQGRYGIIAGERRTVVWAFSLDPAAYPVAEAVAPMLGPLVSGRAGGAPAEVTELLDRLVVSATVDAGARSARAFRHQGLVLLVEGERPDQLDAVVTAWIAALGPG